MILVPRWEMASSRSCTSRQHEGFEGSLDYSFSFLQKLLTFLIGEKKDAHSRNICESELSVFVYRL